MTAPGALPTREEIAEILHDGFERCHDAFMQKHYGETAFQPFHQEAQEEIDCWLAAADALLARLRPAREQQNNVVACVNCKKPVTITALNAVRCDDCGDALRADLAKWENPEGAVMSGGVVDWKKAYQFSQVKLKDTEENLRACAEALDYVVACCNEWLGENPMPTDLGLELADMTHQHFIAAREKALRVLEGLANRCD